MKNSILKTAFYLNLFMLSIDSGIAQPGNEKDIRDLLNKQVAAWNSGNIKDFMEGYWKSDSLLFVSTNGPTYGWQTTLENYKKRYPDTVTMGKLAFEVLRINFLSDEYSFVFGNWNLSRTIGGIGGHFTLLLRKIMNRWYIVADHTS